jgi:hypothetical protein
MLRLLSALFSGNYDTAIAKMRLPAFQTIAFATFDGNKATTQKHKM